MTFGNLVPPFLLGCCPHFCFAAIPANKGFINVKEWQRPISIIMGECPNVRSDHIYWSFGELGSSIRFRQFFTFLSGVLLPLDPDLCTLLLCAFHLLLRQELYDTLVNYCRFFNEKEMPRAFEALQLGTRPAEGWHLLH
jgi:hypothetical protein